MSRFALRTKELSMFILNVKQDIKAMYHELGYKSEVVKFMFTCLPQDYSAVYVSNGTLFLRDNDGNDWHEEYLNDVRNLMGILKAMHHLLPKE